MSEFGISDKSGVFPGVPDINISQEENSLNGKDINIFAEFLTKSNFTIGQELKAKDGGHISIFKDAQGKTVGSINYAPDGKVRNVAFDQENGDSYSYNDLNKDGTIDNGFFIHNS